MSDDSPLENLSEQLRKVSDSDRAAAIESEAGVDSLEFEDIEAVPDAPAFPADESTQGPVAPREETWERYDDALSEITAALEDHGVTDPAGREFDDAVLRLAARNPEAVARLVLEARRDDAGGR